MNKQIGIALKELKDETTSLTNTLNQLKKSIDLIAELVADPSFKIDLVKSVVDKLNINGELFVSRKAFDTLINDIILLLDRMESEKNRHKVTRNFIMELQGIF